MTRRKKDDYSHERAEQYLVKLAQSLGLPDMSVESLSRRLGLDQLTPQKLAAWYHKNRSRAIPSQVHPEAETAVAAGAATESDTAT